LGNTLQQQLLLFYCSQLEKASNKLFLIATDITAFYEPGIVIILFAFCRVADRAPALMAAWNGWK
jgi:hypothetical protein